MGAPVDFIKLEADDPIIEIGTFNTGDPLFHVGRSSGVKFGVCSGIKPDIDWPEHGCLTSEWMVSGKGKPFCDYGDSGAWVMNEDGLLVGMVFGASLAGPAYVTPIQCILADIKARTGLTARLPRRS